MSSLGSVTLWFEKLQAGDDHAAGPLWRRYEQRLKRTARRKLKHSVLPASDEDDIAQVVFIRLWQGAVDGKYPWIHDRDGLWSLLFTLTAREVINHHRYNLRKKRRLPSGAVRHCEHTELQSVPAASAGLPDWIVMMRDTWEHLLSKLGKPDLVEVARLKLEGYREEDIARRLSCVPRTVQRKVRIIRSLWREAWPDDT